MKTTVIAVCAAMSMILASGATAETQSEATPLIAAWEAAFGAAPDGVRLALEPADIPRDLASALQGSARIAPATTGPAEETAVGDLWAVCLSAQGTCQWADVGGTFDPDCDQRPIADVFWLYTTMPARLSVSAGPNDIATWEAFTQGQTGTFQNGIITGTSCVVIDTGFAMVIRSNGIGQFTP